MELKFTKSTDTEHEIKLTSSLIYAEWCSGLAFSSQTVSFEVVTSFVGNGAKIKITGKSEGGKKLGKIKDKIKNNKYIGRFEIPDDIEIGDEIYFEVGLSKNGIDGESNRIPVYPAPKVSNMKWSAKEARRGDVLKLTADVGNVISGTEVLVTIYEYDRDKAHDKIAEIPAEIENEKLELLWEYEYHEDTDEIPSQEELDRYGASYNPPEYFFTIKIGETEYGLEQESGILEFKDWIEITLENDIGEPVPNAEYVVRLPDGQEKRGNLDSDGKVRIDGIPPGRFNVFFPNMPE